MKIRPRQVGKGRGVGIFEADSLEDVRKHPVFSHWEDYYHLYLSSDSSSIKMVKDGHTYDQGIVVAFLETTKS